MTAQVLGIILAIFAALVAVGIYWGGFAEEKRALTDGKHPQK